MIVRAVSFLTVIVIALLIWMGFQAVLYQPHPVGAARISNLKQTGISLLMYSIDHDDRLPFRDEWMDAGLAYAKGGKGIFRYLALGEKRKADEYGIAFNSFLDRRLMDGPAKPEEVPLTYSSRNPLWNASDPFTSLEGNRRVQVCGWTDRAEFPGWAREQDQGEQSCCHLRRSFCGSQHQMMPVCRERACGDTTRLLGAPGRGE